MGKIQGPKKGKIKKRMKKKDTKNIVMRRKNYYWRRQLRKKENQFVVRKIKIYINGIKVAQERELLNNTKCYKNHLLMCCNFSRLFTIRRISNLRNKS